MADLTITAANVVASSNASLARRTAGAAVTAGKVVYRDAADLKSKLTDSDSATVAARSPDGICLNGASDGQPLDVLTEGDITIGATLVPGTTYYLSPTPGGICPLEDLSAGDYVVIVGLAKSVSVLSVKFHEAGVAL